MKIYTKAGDGGETGLLGGTRISKTDLRIQAVGAVDELNAVIGWAVIQTDGEKGLLHEIQSALFDVGSSLASANPSGGIPLDASLTAKLEASMDEQTGRLPHLKNFILPGGSELAARLHIARTVCRRAEIMVLELHETSPLGPDVLAFLNRLSDWLFVYARTANQRTGLHDIIWNPR